MNNAREDFVALLNGLNIAPADKSEMIANYDLLQSKKGSLKGPWAVAFDGNTILEGDSAKELQALVKARSGNGGNSYIENIVP
jgi:hypothetical protein